jgi:tubulin beta
MMHSLGGGTGSGLGSLILEKLSEDYSDKICFNFSVFPGSANGGNSDVVVEPYNTVLGLNSLVESSDAVFSVENSALYKICSNNFKLEHPSYGDINSIIAQAMSDSTASLRFPGVLNNCDIRKLTTNLIPFPRLHFIT